MMEKQSQAAPPPQQTDNSLILLIIVLLFIIAFGAYYIMNRGDKLDDGAVIDIKNIEYLKNPSTP